MFNLISEASRLFSKMDSYYEAAAEANATFLCTASQLPSVAEIEKYLDGFCKCDTIELSMNSYLDFTCCSANPQAWKDEYSKFVESNEPTDNVTINVHINKARDDRGSLSIYSFDNFVSYYTSRPFHELLHELSAVLNKHHHLAFHVMDKEVNLSTESVCFYNNISMLTSGTINREELFTQLNNASLFLNRNEFLLAPCDFRIVRNVSSDTSQLTDLLKKLETIFSYIYLAHSAHIVNDQVVLQLSPSATNMALTYAEALPCQHICNLYQWAFSGDHSIERVGIVRNLLELNCKTIDDLNLKDETLLLSAKSNYILFQKKTIDKYIELKNSISLAIVEATNNMQEILQTLVDAVRNNFVAVIMFLITVVITDSISWDDLASGTVLNSDLLLVIKVFCVSSFLYLLVTLVSIFLKWSFFSRGYREIKANYKDILDADDLLRAFDNDKAINYVKKTIVLASSITSTIWIIFLFLLCWFVW